MFIESNYSTARQITAIASEVYDEKVDEYEYISNVCQSKIANLDSKKIEIWSLFGDFKKCFDSIHSKPVVFAGKALKEEINISSEELEETMTKSQQAVKLMDNIKKRENQLAVSDGVFASLDIINEVASTTFLGDSPLLIPLQIVALPFTLLEIGLKKNIGKGVVAEAQKMYDKTSAAVQKYSDIECILVRLADCCDDVIFELDCLEKKYVEHLSILKKIVVSKTNYSEFTDEEVYVLESTLLLLKMLKTLCEKQFISKEESSNEIEENATEIYSDIVEIEAKRDRIEKIDATMPSFENAIHISSSAQEVEQVEERKGYELKNVEIGNPIGINGYRVYRNCKIVINCKGNGAQESYAIKVDGGRLLFDKCVFEVKKHPNGPVIFTNNGRIEFRDCIFNNIVFGTHDTDGENYCRLNDINEPEKVKQCFVQIEDAKDIMSSIRVSGCKFDTCSDTFAYIYSKGRITMTKTDVSNHRGNFVFAAFGVIHNNDGITIDQCNFKNNSVYVEDSDSYSSVNPNALLEAENDGIRIYNSYFGQSTNQLIRCDGGLGGLIAVKNTSFDNIEAPSPRESSDSLASMFFGPISIPVIEISDCEGNIEKVTFSNCAGMKFGSTGEFGNKPVIISDGHFSNCHGTVTLSYGKMTHCKFDNCKFTLIAEGKVNEYVTEIADCEFTKCSSKKSLISCRSYLSKEGEAVYIHGTPFIECKAEHNVNMYVTDFGLFNRVIEKRVGKWDVLNVPKKVVKSGVVSICASTDDFPKAIKEEKKSIAENASDYIEREREEKAKKIQEEEERKIRQLKDIEDMTADFEKMNEAELKDLIERLNYYPQAVAEQYIKKVTEKYNLLVKDKKEESANQPVKKNAEGQHKKENKQDNINPDINANKVKKVDATENKEKKVTQKLDCAGLSRKYSELIEKDAKVKEYLGLTIMFVGDPNLLTTLKKMVRYCQPSSENEKIICCLDSTVLGSGKKGFFISDKAIYPVADRERIRIKDVERVLSTPSYFTLVLKNGKRKNVDCNVIAEPKKAVLVKYLDEFIKELGSI